MLKFFEKRDPWGNGYALWVIFALAFFLPLIVTSIRQIQLENEVETWLPENDPEAVSLAWFRDHFEDADRFFMTWEGSTFDDPRIPALKKQLMGFVDEAGISRQSSAYISRIVTPREIVERMVEQNVPVEQAFERLKGIMLGHGALKIQLNETSRARKDQVILQITSRLKAELGVEVELIDHPVTTWIDYDGKLEQHLEELQPQHLADAGNKEVNPMDEEEEIPIPVIPPHDFQLTWPGFRPGTELTTKIIALCKSIKGRASQEYPDGFPMVEDAFIKGGSPVAVVIDLSPTGKSNRHDAINDVFAAAEDVLIPVDTIHIGGRPIGAETLNAEVIKSTWNTSVAWWKVHERSIVLLSGLVGMVLSFITLRSIPLALMVLCVSYYTTAAAVALVPVTGGTMNMVLIVMPSLLFVLTLSGAIHLANYWRYAQKHNMPNPVGHAVRMAATPCSLASVTTALGLISLMSSPLAPVRDFGFYSAMGCLLSLVMVLVALPSLLQIWSGGAITSTTGQQGSILDEYSSFICKYHGYVHGFCWFLLIAAGSGLYYFQTETKVIRYFSPDARIVKDYNFLENNITGVNQIDAVIRFKMDEIIKAEEADELNFLQRMEVIRRVEEKIRNHPEISGAVSLADFFPVDEPPAEDASFIRRTTYNKKVYTTQERIITGEDKNAQSFIVVADQPADLKKKGDQSLCLEGDELWRITAQASVTADNDYGKLVREMDEIIRSELKFHPYSSHFVTGMVPVFLRTQQAVLDSLIMSFALAYVMIAIVMMITLRSVSGGFIAMLPNLWPVGFIFGGLSWLGWKIDIGTMVTASVALGIAVDGTLHLITWFQDSLKAGTDRKTAIKKGLIHCAPAMVQTSMIVALGLLVLSPASLLLISRFGILMSALIAAALVADIVFMPVVLAGPLGAYLVVKVNKKEKPSAVKFAEEMQTPEKNELKGPHADFSKQISTEATDTANLSETT